MKKSLLVSLLAVSVVALSASPPVPPDIGGTARTG
jgi:hypothetical protein